jgi:hypothetical protein
MKLNASEINAADTLIAHLCERIDNYAAVGHPLRDRYVGFCAVTAAAHIETLVKEKILDFCQSQNKYLYAVFSGEFERFNGRIAYQELRNLLARFDDNADKRMGALVARLTRYRARSTGEIADLVVAYKSLLSIRHSFSHNINATFPQVTANDLRGYIAASKRIASAFLRCIPR